MTYELRYTLTLRRPVVLASLAGDANTVRSEGYALDRPSKN